MPEYMLGYRHFPVEQNPPCCSQDEQGLLGGDGELLGGPLSDPKNRSRQFVISGSQA